MTQCPCPACKGRRLRPEALAVTVRDLSIMEATEPLAPGAGIFQRP